MRLVTPFALVLGGTLCVAHPARAKEPSPAGAVMAVGGALRYDDAVIWPRMVELAGGKGAHFVVFATASDNPHESAELAITALQRAGATAEHIEVAPALTGTDLNQETHRPAWVEKVRSARGVYFTGGAQARIVDTLMPDGRVTPLLQAIRDVQASGGVIAGSSAGAAIMSARMFRDAGNPIEVMKVEDWARRPPSVDVGPGLGFLAPSLFVDQHFLKRGRLGRALALMGAEHLPLGIGIDEATAIIVRGNDAEVVGETGVLLMDLSAASYASTPALTLRGVRLTYLEDGDRVDLQTRSITPSQHKRDGRGLNWRTPGFKPTHADAPFVLDMQADSVIVTAMSWLVDSQAVEMRGLAMQLPDTHPDARADLGFEYRLYKGDATRAWVSEQAGRDRYTIAAVDLDLTPVRIAHPLYEPWQ